MAATAALKVETPTLQSFDFGVDLDRLSDRLSDRHRFLLVKVRCMGSDGFTVQRAAIR